MDHEGDFIGSLVLYFPLRKSTHNPSAINFAARTFLRRTLLGAAASDYAPMADGGSVGGSYDGIGSDGASGFGGGDMGGGF